MICVYLCVPVVSSEFRDGAGDLPERKSRSIAQVGRKRRAKLVSLGLPRRLLVEYKARLLLRINGLR